MENNITNILVCGIGGQGVMTATEILAEAAIAEGHDAKKTEVAGMAQRGGVVTSHLRFGPKVLSPQIAPGTVHVLLGFEAAEALRWSAYLRPDGLALARLQGRPCLRVPVDRALVHLGAGPREEVLFGLDLDRRAGEQSLGVDVG